MLKLIRWVKKYLPISRKEYYAGQKKVVLALQAVAQADEQHGQIEMSLVQNMNAIQKGNKGKKPPVPQFDPAYK